MRGDDDDGDSTKTLTIEERLRIGGYAAPRLRSGEGRKVRVVKDGVVVREINSRELALKLLAKDEIEFGVVDDPTRCAMCRKPGSPQRRAIEGSRAMCRACEELLVERALHITPSQAKLQIVRLSMRFGQSKTWAAKLVELGARTKDPSRKLGLPGRPVTGAPRFIKQRNCWFARVGRKREMVPMYGIPEHDTEAAQRAAKSLAEQEALGREGTAHGSSLLGARIPRMEIASLLGISEKSVRKAERRNQLLNERYVRNCLRRIALRRVMEAEKAAQ